nr:dna-directed rna polymerase i subunit rpa2 [Quercus suber]
MPSSTTHATTEAQPAWSTEFDTRRRHKLFRHPPTSETAYPTLAAAIKPHVDSFNVVFAEHGQIHHALKDIGTKTFLDGSPSQEGRRNRLQVRVTGLFVEKSRLPLLNKLPGNRDILPVECRERHVTYRGRFQGRLEYRVNDGDWKQSVREFGYLPLMLRSNRCHLEGLSPKELVDCREETEELGGYFIVNGIEKLIRMLVVNKRNFPMAIIRPSFEGRGATYTKYGIQIRSVRPDQTSQTNVLHYLNDGNVTFRFSWRKNEYLVPVMMILKALVETNDREIFEGIVGTAKSQDMESKQFVIDRMELLLTTYKVYNMQTRAKTRAFLGSKFRVVLGVPEDLSDEDAGAEFLRKIVLPHLGTYDVTEANDADKFRMMLFMIRKLYALVEGECAVDNPDAVSNQEILLPGFLYGMIVKERVEEWLSSIGLSLREWGRSNQHPAFTDKEFDRDFMTKVVRKTNENIGQALDYFLSTGNLVSPSGLDLQQISGFTVVAEKINFYRFISHFRMVHRGSFFAQLKTTTVRKLLPESWGFLCPVHTPDGSPCGLLNHLAHKCIISTQQANTANIPRLIAQLGVSDSSAATLEESVVVQLDGKILGFCSPEQAKVIGDTLRYWKVEGSHDVPLDLEVGYIPSSNGGQYPGIYMFANAARLIRPVKYLPLDQVDHIGSFEQPFMSIACTEPEVVSGDSTHVEYDPTNILSIVANQTPFSDFNQSPRNMYQCLSADHEVLTNTGWKALSTIQAADQVMTMDLHSGTQQWNAVQATTRLAHHGPLFRLKSGGMDAVCNESHRWYLNTKDQPATYAAYTTQQMADGQLVALRSSSGKNMGHWHRKTRTITHLNHKIPAVGQNGNALYLWSDCPWLPRSFVRDEACNLDWCRLVGLVMADGGVQRTTGPQGQGCHQVQIHQRVENPAANAAIDGLLERLTANLPGFVVTPPCVPEDTEKHTWTFAHRGMYDFFLPMVRGPRSYDPLDVQMCRAYQAPRYQALSQSDDEPVLPVPAGCKTGDWWHLRRWMYYPWLYLLARDQARAIIKGMAVADGEWSLLAKARSHTDRRSGAKRVKLSMSSVEAEQLAGQSIDKGVVHVSNSSIPMMHDLSVLGLLADTRVNIDVERKKDKYIPSTDGNTRSTRWRISFAFADSALTVAAPMPQTYDNPRHDGFVYCLTVPNGNFLARRSIHYSDHDKTPEVLDAAQKPFFTGNCQMGKQTMGTSGTALKYRTDNKSYRLQTGQTPVVRPPLYNEYGLDNFPNGTNAVVAVISYTGYDMDDAMILNKTAHERGFGYGTIYKTKKIELAESTSRTRSSVVTQVFGFAPSDTIKAQWLNSLDEDGLPTVGVKVKEGDLLAASYTVTKDAGTGEYVNRDGVTHLHKYKDTEEAYIEEVKIIGNENGTNEPCQGISIRLRIPRAAVIGDKFSSRHGQKGVLSQKWPTVNMPFTESGMQPDVIINPHAFPSRMTIGMFVESLAGKSGALHGLAQNSTPFKFKDKEGETAVEYFGHQLQRAGYNYHGNEPMYSGITGEELAADIYIGVVYYQRLRHMVNDKFQVRTTGPVTPLTGQPIKGRAKGGGIRVGEMERDSLLAHGTAFLLQDRLMNCSDYTRTWLCRACGSFLATQPSVAPYAARGKAAKDGGRTRCRRCSRRATPSDPRSECWEDRRGVRWFGGDDVTVVAVPGVLKYLDVELAAMGVQMKFKVEP